MDSFIKQKLAEFLAEDIGTGDVTSASLKDTRIRRGWYTARRSGVVAGLDFAKGIFQLLGVANFTALVEDGEFVQQGTPIAYVDGQGHLLLQGERVSLNLLQRLSGIATKTRSFVEIANRHGQTRITDTRKTTPGMRWFEKYAVRIGGGFNHRWGLYDCVMLKDNHIKLAGGISKAVGLVRQNLGHTYKIEVEVEDFGQLQQALDAKADIIMLDNMSPGQVAQAVKLVAGKAITEASGSINETSLAEYAATGVDYISIGALTHSVHSLDIGFDLDKPKE